jgi:hypothetical protein
MGSQRKQKSHESMYYRYATMCRGKNILISLPAWATWLTDMESMDEGRKHGS